MGYRGLVSDVERRLKRAEANGFPEWASSYCRSRMKRAAMARQQELQKRHGYVGLHRAMWRKQLCHAMDVIEAFGRFQLFGVT